MSLAHRVWREGVLMVFSKRMTYFMNEIIKQGSSENDSSESFQTAVTQTAVIPTAVVLIVVVSPEFI